MKKVLVIYGGQSTEHEVSCNSAFSVLNAIDFLKYDIDLIYIAKDGCWYLQSKLTERPQTVKTLTNNTTELFDYNRIREYDLAFPILHGTKGEDGAVQGLFEMFNLPYIGSGIYASSIAIDKILTKKHCEIIGIPQVPYVKFTKNEWQNNSVQLIEAIKQLEYPIFVKPPKLGSSIGITKVEESGKLIGAIEMAFLYGSEVLIEKGINVREVEVGIIGKDNLEVSLIGEIKFNSANYYDYETKYNLDNSKLIVPAEITQSQSQMIKQFAVKIYKYLNCTGLARVDFFIDSQGNIYFNEINTFPGFTNKSMFPMLWEASGLNYRKLIDRLIEC